jgi:hypothetical protein
VSSNLDQGEVYNIMWYRLSVTCDRSVIFSGSSGFIHQQNWPTWYSLNIIESGIKHHERNNQSLIVKYFLIVQMGFETEMRQVPACRSVLLVDETGGPGKNHRPITSHWQSVSHNVIHLSLIEIRTHDISGDRRWLHR